VSGHPKAPAPVDQTSPYFTLTPTQSSATVQVTVTLSAAGFQACTAVVSFTTFAAPSGGTLLASKVSLVAGGSDTVDLKCTGWITSGRGISSYTFYMDGDVISQITSDTLTFTPPYQNIDKAVRFGCSVTNDLGMVSPAAGAAGVGLGKTIVAAGQESVYLGNLVGSVPALPAGTTTNSAAFAATVTGIAGAAAALDLLNVDAATKATNSAALGAKLKAAAAVGDLSPAQKEQFSKMGATLVAMLDKTNANAFADMYAVMKGATKVPVSAKAAASSNAYSAAIFALFPATRFHALQSTGAQDSATSQAIDVIAKTAQGVLFGTSATIPNTRYSATSATYDVDAVVNTPSALQANIQTNASININIGAQTGTAVIGFVRITFRSNPRLYASAATVDRTSYAAFSLFDAVSFTAGTVGVTYNGKTGGAAQKWDKNDAGIMRNGWTACTACALDTVVPPTEFAYVQNGGTPATTPAPPATPATAAPTVGSVATPSPSSAADLAWIAGPIIGGVVFIGLVIGGIVYCQRKNTPEGGSASANRVQDDSTDVENEHRV